MENNAKTTSDYMVPVAPQSRWSERVERLPIDMRTETALPNQTGIPWSETRTSVNTRSKMATGESKSNDTSIQSFTGDMGSAHVTHHAIRTTEPLKERLINNYVASYSGGIAERLVNHSRSASQYSFLVKDEAKDLHQTGFSHRNLANVRRAEPFMSHQGFGYSTRMNDIQSIHVQR
jgi:hypothetical protein